MSDEIRVLIASHGKGRKNLVMYYVDPVTEKTVTRSARTDDRTQAQRAAAVWQDELNTGRYQAPLRITWKDFRERYEAEKLSTLAPGTQEAARTALNHLERIINPARLSVLNSRNMSRFQAELKKWMPPAPPPAPAPADGKKPKKARRHRSHRKDTTIDGVLGHLKAALNWAVRMKMLHELPDIDRPRRAKGQKHMRGRPITAEEFDRMIVSARKVRPRDSAVWIHYLTGLWLSGLRLEESLVFSWDLDSPFCVDLSGRHPRFRIYAEAEKGHQDRLLPMTPDFAEFLLKTPEAQRHGVVFKINGLDTGKPITGKRVSRIVSKIGQKASPPVVVNKDDEKYASAHDLRRAFGTRWASRVKPAVLQKLMRHASINTTMAYYVDLDADELGDELWKVHGQLDQAPHTFPHTSPKTTPETETAPVDESTEAVEPKEVS